MSTALSFEKLHNIRDLGGEMTADGRTIIPGKLIRSGHLSILSEKDRDRLSELVDTVVDFRMEAEKAAFPDIVIPGVEYCYFPVEDRNIGEAVGDDNRSPRFSEPRDADRKMLRMYEAAAKDTQVMKMCASFLRVLLKPHDRAVLWHCTVGKDRAGMAAAILEEILGVPRQAIIEEYLSTNRHLEGNIGTLIEMAKKRSGNAPGVEESMRVMLQAKREYIDAFYRTMEENYGTSEAYIRQGLGLTEEEVEMLKERYLTE